MEEVTLIEAEQWCILTSTPRKIGDFSATHIAN
jgi:hypothetical protein